MINNTQNIICERGQLLFGEEIYNNDNSCINDDIKCSNYCIIIKANTFEILNYLNCSFVELVERSNALRQLKKVRLFKNLPLKKLEEIFSRIKVEKYKKDEYIMTQGEEGNKFYIVKKGSIDVFVNNKYVRRLNSLQYLGERALFFREPRSATCIAHKDCEMYYLEKEDFDNVIDTNLQTFLMKRLYLQDETVQLADLTFYKNLGQGSYGNVSLVKSEKNNYFYAIKNISNKQILYSKLHHNIELERNILLKIDHPFIVKLVKSLKDDNYIYYLMDYIKGKELFDVIRDIGLLNKFQTQFYGASIMLAVQYLHERKFKYRDIKPENIMVLGNGFIKLIDFGTAKSITDKTKTIIGTPHYMAPEVILGEGYSFKVDFWSIAVCMYEFMCGGVPFGENHEEAMDVYLSIINE
jgi:cGMP-dependent protein kinase